MQLVVSNTIHSEFIKGICHYQAVLNDTESHCQLMNDTESHCQVMNDTESHYQVMNDTVQAYPLFSCYSGCE